VVEWVLNIWRKEGVIDHDLDTMGVCNSRYSSDVCEGEGGVGWRLNPDQFCLRAYQISDFEFDARRECYVDVVGSGECVSMESFSLEDS
jgi:hypothetical protein